MFNIVSTEKEWRKELTAFKGYDFYHTWDYHDISRQNGEGEPVLFVYKSETCSICWPLLLRTFKAGNRQWRDLTSAYGYPGPLAKGVISTADESKWRHHIIRWCHDQRIVSIFSRLNPLVGHDPILEELGETRTIGTTIPIDLRVPLDEQRTKFRASLKRGINKLTRMGSICREVEPLDHLEDFITIYEETMRFRNAKDQFFFSREYYRRIVTARDFETKMYGVFMDGRMVCTGIFIFTETIVQYHLGGTLPSFYSYSPSKLLYDKVRIDATAKGAEWFMLGGGLGGNNDPLLYFKSGFSDLTMPYRVANIIVDPAAYGYLERLAIASARKTGDTLDPGFFPSYRSVPGVAVDQWYSTARPLPVDA
ncbi:GNAT family N-acetyltransferase [Halomonas maura]|uniref:GNAT family N-acetyltransferase n=1 Tax=Halomonas maura TaxID=117606 RepID=UPI0025B3A7F5|nr:GNAT family N-acetyltransferase [Halomonas maura]MDN3554774.1 GNAT family N-acetyltransferase [Halomonas maura]